MAVSRPQMPNGYLGPQSKWREWGMATVNHNNPEITTNTCSTEVKLRTTQPMKVTANLVDCSNDAEYKDLVFTQTQGLNVDLIVTLPNAGFFKLQIFALLSSDDSKSLPNVYNYLIRSTAPPSGPVAAFPKQFAQWKDGCWLHQPFHVQGLDTALFEVTIPGAKGVAVTVDKEWFPLAQGADGAWRGEVKGLQQLKSRTPMACLNANYGGAEANKYTSLLQYTL